MDRAFCLLCIIRVRVSSFRVFGYEPGECYRYNPKALEPTIAVYLPYSSPFSHSSPRPSSTPQQQLCLTFSMYAVWGVFSVTGRESGVIASLSLSKSKILTVTAL